MGCGASTQAASGASGRAAAFKRRPLLALLCSLSRANHHAGAVVPPRGSSNDTTGAAAASPATRQPMEVETVLEAVSSLGEPSEEVDSPKTSHRMTDRKKPESAAAGRAAIPVVCSASFDAGDDDIKAAVLLATQERLAASGEAAPAPAPTPLYDSHDNDSVRIKGAVVLELAGFANTSDSIDVDRLAPPEAETPSMPAVMLRHGAAGDPQQALASRYDDISLSDDEDEAQGFDLERWRRFYKWNKKKHADLLEFLWRRFDPRTHSIYCATYKDQDKLFATFQGDNVVHGLCCRLEKSGVDAFGIMHTLVNGSSDNYKVLGIFILSGSELPAKFSSLPDFDQFQVLKADTKDPLVRQFVGNLITGASPVPEYQVVCSQEVMGGGK